MNLLRAVKEPSLQRRWLFLFFGGVCTGIVYANLMGARYVDQIRLLSDYLLQKYRGSEILNGELFWYCLRARILPVCYIWIFGLILFGCAVGYVYVFWYGFSSGFLLSVATLRFGMKGILLCVTGVLPQYIFYIPAMLVTLLAGSTVSMRLYGKENYSHTIAGGRRKLIGIYFTLLIGITVVCIIGALTESYVNPIFLKRILSLF